MKRRTVRAARLAAIRATLTACLTVPSYPCLADDAERPHTRFHYVRERGAESCPDEAQLRDAVAGRLGYVPFDDSARMQVDVQIRRRGRKLLADVSVDPGDDSGARTRSLNSAARNCDELADGLSLAVSIAIDPLSLTRPAAPAPVPPEPPPPRAPEVVEPSAPVLPEPPSAPAPGPAPEAKPRRRWYAGADLLGSMGVVPAASAGLTVFGALAFRRGSLALELRGDLPRGKQSDRQEVSAMRASVQVVPCGELRWFFACGVVSAGALIAQGKGSGGQSDDLALVMGSGARVGAMLELRPHLFLRGFVEGVGTPTKIALFRAEREIWATPALNGTLALGLFGAWP